MENSSLNNMMKTDGSILNSKYMKQKLESKFICFPICSSIVEICKCLDLQFKDSDRNRNGEEHRVLLVQHLFQERFEKIEIPPG